MKGRSVVRQVIYRGLARNESTPFRRLSRDALSDCIPRALTLLSNSSDFGACHDAEPRAHGEPALEVFRQVFGILTMDLDCFSRYAFVDSLCSVGEDFGKFSVVVFNCAFHSLSGSIVLLLSCVSIGARANTTLVLMPCEDINLYYGRSDRGLNAMIVTVGRTPPLSCKRPTDPSVPKAYQMPANIPVSPVTNPI